ncbi:hypothetical protein C8J57DRAFT_1227604 [Mycena rebaudengoi]|nr:hypothetical protein C8J57DRAFT_1227604 [Mycena rebaudengoi]
MGRTQHGNPKQLLGSWEVYEWNPCENCKKRKKWGQCIIDCSVSPQCRACLGKRQGCDRKIRFLFDRTKDTFFPSLKEFQRVYNTTRVQTDIRRIKKTENKKAVKHLYLSGTSLEPDPAVRATYPTNGTTPQEHLIKHSEERDANQFLGVSTVTLAGLGHNPREIEHASYRMDAAEAVRRIHELEAKLQAANDQIKAMEMTLRNQSFTSNVSGSRAETSINQHTSGDNTYGTYGLLVGFRGCVGKTE